MRCAGFSGGLDLLLGKIRIEDGGGRRNLRSSAESRPAGDGRRSHIDPDDAGRFDSAEALAVHPLRLICSGGARSEALKDGGLGDGNLLRYRVSRVSNNDVVGVGDNDDLT